MEEDDTAAFLKIVSDFRSEPSNISSILMSDSILKSSFNASNSSDLTIKKRKIDDSLLIDEQVTNAAYCPSPWEFRHLRAELIESKSQIIKLEDRIDQLHKQSKENTIFFDKEKNEMKSQLEISRKQKKMLENKLMMLRKREADAVKELHELKKDTDMKKIETSEKETTFECTHTMLREKISELENGVDDSTQLLNKELQSAKEELARKTNDLEEFKKLCQSLESRLAVALKDEKLTEELKLRLQENEIKIKDLEYEKAEAGESRMIVNNLRTKVFQLEKIEAELTEKKEEVNRLREAIGEKLMLKERVHDLETKLAAVDDREREANELKARNTELESEVEEWSALSKCFIDEVNILRLKCYVEELRKKELTSISELNTLNSKLTFTEKSLTNRTEELKRIKDKDVKLEDGMRRCMSENQILKKKVLLVTRERDSYREQLDLYEKDLTLTSIDPDSAMKDMCTQQRTRINSMELSLNDYRTQLANVEKQLQHSQKLVNETSNQAEGVEKLKRELSKAKSEIEELKKLNDELNIRLEDEATSVNKRDTLKTIHMKVNPTATAQKKFADELDQLRTECERLRARVKLLEEDESRMDLTQRVSEAVQGSQTRAVKELEQKLDSANLKMQRLKEVFKKTSQEFRDVCYMLLGYKIDVLSNKIYRLSSMYSESPDQYLMFKLRRPGMEMLETPFAVTLSELVQEHLHKQNSIPSFLSTLTLSLMANDDRDGEDEDEVEVEEVVDDDDDDDEEEDNDRDDEEPEYFDDEPVDEEVVEEYDDPVEDDDDDDSIEEVDLC